jgi:hypothetical protein
MTESRRFTLAMTRDSSQTLLFIRARVSLRRNMKNF